MGSFCSCFCVEDFEEYRNPYGSVHRPYICLRFLSQQFMHMYTFLLQREDHAVSSSSNLASVARATDESFSGTFHSPPRPLAFDDPRFSRIRGDRPAKRHEKSLTQFNDELEPLGRVNSDDKIESTHLAAKRSRSSSGLSQKWCSESLLKHPSIEITDGATYMCTSSEDEDICPTCLEEYSNENPRIMLRCSHHFHLGCIYEWMERSEVCPVCGKVMVFNEVC